MIGIFKGLAVTIATVFRKPITVQYPDGDPPAKLLGQKPKSRVHLPLSSRYMGFPVLLWDDGVDEPACTGCMVCMRYCPTECMTVTMKDNPLFAEGKSKRKKIVDNFEIRMERCILCAICVEVCNFEAIAMSAGESARWFVSALWPTIGSCRVLMPSRPPQPL